ncbi:MAG: GNAT family N-acetyltransferase, partial [Flavonifractor plautii]
YIYALATDPGARSKGYGRQLLRFVDGYLAERGADCVTTVPAEPSLFKFFGTVGFAPCFSTRKLELLKSMLQPAAEGDRAEPVEPGEYNTIRRRLLEGAPAVDYPEELIRYQQGMGRLSGGGLYRLSVDGAEGCAAAEYTDGESVLFKELLLSPDKMGRGLAALERVLPGARCYVRTPALWDGMKGSYLQPFGMLKWY